jgi:L-alanine-DL-glutamate epimerase-like enolase superfamily enzyme
MSITLGAATKLLDNMMVNYCEWHTGRAPQGKKVNSVEETSSLSDKIDTIMAMLANDRAHVDPNNVPLASLVAQGEHVDVNFIKNNNFNNGAYRNNFASDNYRPYPSTNGNGYGNSYGNSSNNTRGVPSDLEVMLKDFISKQTAFNKSVEEKLGKIDVLASKVDSLALDVELLKLKVLPHDVKESKTLNAIQVRIDDNVRMLAELHARWKREDEMARKGLYYYHHW